jgi:hypothetical protein
VVPVDFPPRRKTSVVVAVAVQVALTGLVARVARVPPRPLLPVGVAVVTAAVLPVPRQAAPRTVQVVITTLARVAVQPTDRPVLPAVAVPVRPVRPTSVMVVTVKSSRSLPVGSQVLAAVPVVRLPTQSPRVLPVCTVPVDVVVVEIQPVIVVPVERRVP